MNGDQTTYQARPVTPTTQVAAGTSRWGDAACFADGTSDHESLPVVCETSHRATETRRRRWRIWRSVLQKQGPRWLLFRVLHAAKLRCGWFSWKLPCAGWTDNPRGRISARANFLPASARQEQMAGGQAVAQANRMLAGRQTWFSRHDFDVGFPPPWFRDPWQPLAESVNRSHWSRISDFSAGDIKNVWEPARFGLVFPLVRAFARTHDPRYVEAYWQTIENWREENPPQSGPHWKCGQEVALRLIAWTFGFLAFSDHAATTSDRQAMLAEMIEVSRRRIALNLGYALSQKNNHAISEAAGLFTAGILLERPADVSRGHLLLERLAEQLIYDDGSFSQHSTNYHRLMLEVYLWCIQLGRGAGCPLPERTLDRVCRAGRWLRTLLPAGGGRIANLGPNDGAHLLDLTDLGYLDYRPIIQATGLVTENRKWLPAGPWDELAGWLGCGQEGAGPARRSPAGDPSTGDVLATVRPSTPPAAGGGRPKNAALFPPDMAGGPMSGPIEFAEGGYVVWRRGRSLALLRCPRAFRHRPSQCDLLHFDLWCGSDNLLRDAGTYSYNCPQPWQSYFGSAAAHNTIQFDHRDPMPKLSRFLYAAWPRCAVEIDCASVSAAYEDDCGARHRRRVIPTSNGFRIVDHLGGAFGRAVLRWRLDPAVHWEATGSGCRSARLELEVVAAPVSAAISCRLVEGWESLHYQEKTKLPVLECTVSSDCRQLTTSLLLTSHFDADLPEIAVSQPGSPALDAS